MARVADQRLAKLTGYLLRRAATLAMPEVDRVLQRFGLRRSTYSSLVVIVDNPGLKQSQLADILLIERSNIVKVIDRLESRGLVKRMRKAADRRAYALLPTELGRRQEIAATQALTDMDRALTAGLSGEEIAVLQRCLSTIQQNAAEMEQEDVRQVSSS